MRPSSLPRYASITSGFARTSSGVPSAILRPKLSTLTWSEIRITRLMWCSTSSTVSSWSSRSRRMKSPSSSTSSWLSPPAGSSSRRSRGFAASARAISTRFWIPYGSAAARSWARAAEADVVERGAAPPSRRTPRPSAWAPTRTFSSTDIDVNRLMFWNVRAIPRSTMRYAGVCEQRLAVELELAVVRRVEAGDDVERRRLAGAVRPDQARDLPRLDVERDAVEGDDAPEAQGDLPNRQQRRH